MDIKEIAINTSMLQSDINNMEAALIKSEQATEKMFESIRALSGMWSGTAHDAFLQQVSLDYELMKDLNKTVNELLVCMQQARKDYDSCEESVSTIIDEITI